VYVEEEGDEEGLLGGVFSSSVGVSDRRIEAGWAVEVR